MSRDSDRECLLRDVLAEDASSEPRSRWLTESIRLARRRRIQRRTRAAIATLGVIAVFTLLSWRPWSNQSAETRPFSNALRIVVTRPLPAKACIQTQLLDSARFVRSTMNATIIGTSPGQFRAISDSELLAFAYPRPAILVRVDPSTETLVFVNLEPNGAILANPL
jgi:hypothetical protein